MSEWGPGTQQRVRALLQRLTQGEDLAGLRRDAEDQSGSPDLNESFLASVALEAGEILAQIGGQP